MFHCTNPSWKKKNIKIIENNWNKNTIPKWTTTKAITVTLWSKPKDRLVIIWLSISKSYSFWKKAIFCNRSASKSIWIKPRKRTESELFRELSLKVLALSGAEIWSISPFFFHIFKTYSNRQIFLFFYNKMVISRLTKRLESSMRAPRKAQILVFHVVLFIFILKLT